MRLVRSVLLSALGVAHGFSLRTGGVSGGPYATLNLGEAPDETFANRAENRRRFFADAGLDGDLVAEVTQVHGDRVVFARPEAGRVIIAGVPGGQALADPVEADAIVAAPGVAAAVRVADCVPILLFDPLTGSAAAVHSGWRGTAARVVEKAVAALENAAGAKPDGLRAALGPSIRRCCYEVSDELAERFESDPAFGPATIDRSTARPRLDLAAANARLLEGAGLRQDHIDDLAMCTACEPARFFSHRRDAGRTGRHLAAIAAGR